MTQSGTSLGALAILENPAREMVSRAMRTLRLEAGQHVFAPGDECTNYVVVKQGSLKVSVTTETGREIVLYHVEPGETCVITVACLMSGSHYDVEGVAATDIEAYILPKPVFEELLATSPSFRQFVFASYGERIQTLIGLVQEIAVKHLDRRLARYLLSHVEDDVVAKTHQTIAADLSTAREVVSRLLSDFEDKGWVELARGRVVIKSPARLDALASGM